jgi:anti-anti-sigma factor
MFEYMITEENDLQCIVAKGRIDGLSSPDIGKVFDDLILAGERTLLLDMAAVHYVSSAGIRILVATQKALKKVGGEIILLGMTDPVFNIFKMSGLVPLFHMAATREEVYELRQRDGAPTKAITREIDGIHVTYVEKATGKGILFVVGSQDKMADSAYGAEDIVPVNPVEMPFGCGLAALGDNYEEYKELFGESLVINNTFFFYPAVKHPSVDFLINAHQNRDATYKFLHGFGFTGDYRYLLSFQGKETPLGLPALIRSFFAVSGANVLGLCIIAESKGIWGMHIKKVPSHENRPANGKSIFDHETFSEWIDFPVEPAFVNNIIVAAGIAVRDQASLGPKASLIPEGNSFHIHGAIFDKAPLGSDIDAFDKELLRIFNEREVHRIQHILGQSRFSGGMAGLVEIEG